MKKGVSAACVCVFCAEHYEPWRSAEMREISMEREGSLAKSGGQ